jgi:hypothetical protein
VVANESLNKIPRKRPTYNMLLEHEWLLPLSPAREDFPQVDAENKAIIGQWVTNTLAQKKVGKQEVCGERTKPPLHTLTKEPE